MLRSLLSLLLSFLLTSVWLVPFARADEAAADRLIRKLLEPLAPDAQPVRLAVLDLVDAEGLPSALGTRLTGDLLPPLLASKRFVLLERAQLNKVIQEQALEQSDFADAQQAIAVGKLSGAQYLLTGRISNAADSVHLDLRLLRAETGEIAAVAQADWPKTDDMRKLLQEKTLPETLQATGMDVLGLILHEVLPKPTAAAGNPVSQPAQAPQAPSPMQPVYFEDFSRFPVGMPLPGFGPQMVVRHSERLDKQVLTTEDPQAQRWGLDLAFPAQFVFEIHAIDTLKQPQPISASPLEFVLFDTQGHTLTLSKRLHGFGFNGSALQTGPWRYLDWNVLALVRMPGLIRFYLNGQLVNQLADPGYSAFRGLQILAPQLRSWAFTQLSLYEVKS